MKYRDFDLLIERYKDRYRARVINSPAGQAVVEFSLPFTELEFENFLLRFGRPRRGTRFVNSSEMVFAKLFGQRLFEAVFAGQVNNCFFSSLDEAKRSDSGLRLRVRLTETPELIDVPWEYLYNPSLDRFLSLGVETPIVRYLELPELIKPLEVEPPLRVLVMIASPYNFPLLDVESEWNNIKKATSKLEKSGLVRVDRMQNATLSALQKHLRRNSYHIFHFIGHGRFDENTQDGLLIIEDGHKRGLEVSAHTLGTLLHNHSSLRLVVLNACEGARASRTDPFAGAAQSLIRQGLSAVIAMQFEITDEAATTLANEFYSALADGYPVDAALVEARTSIFAQGNDIEWGTPVLYMRSPDGRIFDVYHASGKYDTNVEPVELLSERKKSKLRNRSAERLGCTVSIVFAALVFAMVMNALNIENYFKYDGQPVLQNTGVVVEVEPPSAEVLIDDKHMSSTSLSVNQFRYELQAGMHAIKVARSGYITAQDSFEVKPGQVDTMTFFLALAPVIAPPETKGSLTVTVKPQGSIYIDHELRQAENGLPFTARLAAGEYLLTVIHHPAGWKWERKVRIAAGESKELTIDFDRTVKLTVRATPQGAWGDIYIDDINTGFQTPKDLDVRIGQHKIELKREGYKMEEGARILNVESNDTLTFEFYRIN